MVSSCVNSAVNSLAANARSAAAVATHAACTHTSSCTQSGSSSLPIALAMTLRLAATCVVAGATRTFNTVTPSMTGGCSLCGVPQTFQTSGNLTGITDRQQPLPSQCTSRSGSLTPHVAAQTTALPSGTNRINAPPPVMCIPNISVHVRDAATFRRKFKIRSHQSVGTRHAHAMPTYKHTVIHRYVLLYTDT